MSLKRGNIIKYKTSFWGGSLGESQDEVGRLGVIEYSYGEKYGNGECYGGYSVIELDTGNSSCWWDESQLEFIEDGGEHIIQECKNKSEIRKQQMSDLKWIKENWKNEKNLSTTTILTLFEEIKYDSSFIRNGEYIVLLNDWFTLSPIFNAIFDGNYDGMIKSIEIFKTEYKEEKLKLCTNLFNKVKRI